jgi:hypothetical protein
MGKHARFSPSKGKQILNCTASLLLEEQFPDEQTSYAAEGTACHELAEYLLKKYLKIRKKRPVSEWYTEENVEAVDEYVSYCEEQIETARRECPEAIALVEHRVDLTDFVRDCFGTADLVIVQEGKLHICDLKMGKGVCVDAYNNYQMMAYGLGLSASASMFFDIRSVEMTIIQPRLQSVSTWEISSEELEEWGRNFFVPKAEEALSGNGVFCPGEDICRFCKARFNCKARADYFLEVARHEFCDPALLSDEEMAGVLSKADALREWAEEIFAFAQAEAVEHHKNWPGFKLVRGKSNRKYVSEEKVIEAAKAAGYDDIFKTSLIGITEMEKLMGRKNFNTILGDLVYKPEGKVTLVPESDKREAIKTVTAEEDFAE